MKAQEQNNYIVYALFYSSLHHITGYNKKIYISYNKKSSIDQWVEVNQFCTQNQSARRQKDKLQFIAILNSRTNSSMLLNKI